MKVALVCALLFASSVALASQDADFVTFMSFVHKFNKTYSSQKEFEMRFANFQMNMQRVYQYRAQHQLETGESGEGVYGVTKFMDLTAEEFKSQYLGFRGSPNRQGIPVSHPTTTIIPTTFDWRQHGAVTPVKDQGQCGSCWAFSATEEVESMNQRAGNKLTELSVQQIVSCDTVDGGCNGGDTITAYQYIEQAGGLELDSNYPYSSGGGDSGTCADNSPHVVGVHNYTYATPGCTDSCDHQDLNALAANLATVGPISICVYAEPWQVYTGGVLSSGCSHAYGDLDHCVQLVGYNQEASTPYWIIRNSWNTDWGIEGYIWVKIAGNVCGVADEATYVNTFLVQ